MEGERDIRLHVFDGDTCAGGSRGEEVSGGDEGCDDEADGCEEAEDILGAGYC